MGSSWGATKTRAGWWAGTERCLDEVRADLVPVAFGSGIRFFGDYTGSLLLLENPQVVQGDRVLHLCFRVVK